MSNTIPQNFIVAQISLFINDSVNEDKKTPLMRFLKNNQLVKFNKATIYCLETIKLCLCQWKKKLNFLKLKMMRRALKILLSFNVKNRGATERFRERTRNIYERALGEDKLMWWCWYCTITQGTVFLQFCINFITPNYSLI